MQVTAHFTALAAPRCAHKTEQSGENPMDLKHPTIVLNRSSKFELKVYMVTQSVESSSMDGARFSQVEKSWALLQTPHA